MQRIVITGMGIWSCIGSDVKEVEQSLRLGTCGIGTDYRRMEYGYQSPLTGIVPLVDLSSENLRRSQRRCMGEPSEYAYMAVKQALIQSGLLDLQRCGLIVSNDSTDNSLAVVEKVMETYHDTRRMSSGMVFQTLNSTVSMNLASIFHIGGLSLSVSAACAGGGHAVGLAYSLIKSGVLDCCIVVGAQEVGLHGYTSFDALGVFSKRTDDPKQASRPFDALRDGLVPSGGAACVILENEAHAAMGNRKALARVLGYGFSTSPNIVTPDACSEGVAMANALRDADVTASDVAMVMAHATSTRDGDVAEAEALSKLFRGNPFVVSTKCLTGHECWMAGVSQVVYALIQMQHDFVTPNINLKTPDMAAENLNIPTTLIEYVSCPIVLCNAFGFGGTNASLVIGKA